MFKGANTLLGIALDAFEQLAFVPNLIIRGFLTCGQIYGSVLPVERAGEQINLAAAHVLGERVEGRLLVGGQRVAVGKAYRRGVGIVDVSPIGRVPVP